MNKVVGCQADNRRDIVEERPLIAPDIVAKEQALNFQGLLLLSRLPKDVPLDSDDSTVPVFSCLASFSDESDPWTSPKTQELACSLAKEYAVPDHLPALLHGLLQERIKPLFAKSKNPAITQQGRKAIDPLPSNGTAHGDLDTESKPWKYRDVYIVTVFRWILKHLDVYLLLSSLIYSQANLESRRNP